MINNQPYMARPTYIDLNLLEFQCYSFIISLDKLGKCNGGCNSVEDLFTNMCIPSQTKDIMLKLHSKV